MRSEDRIEELERQIHKYETDNMPILRDQIQQLRDAIELMLIGGNHLALYHNELWPTYNTCHSIALKRLGAGLQYDMWCCWNAI